MLLTIPLAILVALLSGSAISGSSAATTTLAPGRRPAACGCVQISPGGINSALIVHGRCWPVGIWLQLSTSDSEYSELSQPSSSKASGLSPQQCTWLTQCLAQSESSSDRATDYEFGPEFEGGAAAGSSSEFEDGSRIPEDLQLHGAHRDAAPAGAFARGSGTFLFPLPPAYMGSEQLLSLTAWRSPLSAGDLSIATSSPEFESDCTRCSSSSSSTAAGTCASFGSSSSESELARRSKGQAPLWRLDAIDTSEIEVEIDVSVPRTRLWRERVRTFISAALGCRLQRLLPLLWRAKVGAEGVLVLSARLVLLVAQIICDVASWVEAHLETLANQWIIEPLLFGLNRIATEHPPAAAGQALASFAYRSAAAAGMGSVARRMRRSIEIVIEQWHPWAVVAAALGVTASMLAAAVSVASVSAPILASRMWYACASLSSLACSSLQLVLWLGGWRYNCLTPTAELISEQLQLELDDHNRELQLDEGLGLGLRLARGPALKSGIDVFHPAAGSPDLNMLSDPAFASNPARCGPGLQKPSNSCAQQQQLHMLQHDVNVHGASASAEIAGSTAAPAPAAAAVRSTMTRDSLDVDELEGSLAYLDTPAGAGPGPGFASLQQLPSAPASIEASGDFPYSTNGSAHDRSARRIRRTRGSGADDPGLLHRDAHAPRQLSYRNELAAAATAAAVPMDIDDPGLAIDIRKDGRYQPQ